MKTQCIFWLLCLWPLTGLSGQIPTQGLLAYFPFNGDARDASGNGHHGIVHGAKPAMDRFGNPGGALSFFTSRVEIPDTSTLRPHSFTYSFWFTIDGPCSPYLLSKSRGGGLRETFAVWLRAGQIQTFVTRREQETYLHSTLWIPAFGQWHHLAVSGNYTTRELSIWVDGQRFAEVPLNVVQEYGSRPWIIGALQVDSNYISYTFGRFDDLRMYNRALRAGEIQALAAEQPGGQPVSVDWAQQPPPPGKYLIIQAEHNGVADNIPHLVELTGLPPLIQRPWFVLAGLLLLFGLSYAGLWLRQRQRERLRLLELDKWKALEAERGRIARDLHDDLGSGLSAISLLSEVARQKSVGTPVDEEIRQLAAASHGLSVRIREIIWMVSARNDRLDYLVSYLGHYIVEQFEHSAIELTLRLPDTPPPARLVGGEQRRALFHAFKEALRLAAVHPGVRALQCTFHTAGDFEVRLQWTGSPFALENNPQTGIFLQLIKKWRETGGRFTGTDGPPVEWRFGLHFNNQ